MDEDYLISIWKNFDETHAHKCVEEIYKKQGFHVKNYHRDDRINENGVDILCRKDEIAIGFSIKKKPRKGDIDQLQRFAEKNPDIRKYYIFLDHPTAPFENEKNKYNDVTYWDWTTMHKELIENASKRYILSYFSVHPLFLNLYEIFKILYDNHDVNFSQTSANKEEINFLWNIKDDSVKLKAILHYLKEKWNRILMDKTHYDPGEYLEYIEKVHYELNLVNSITGRVLHRSFKEMQRKYPYLLSRYWYIVSRRSKWKEFTSATIEQGKLGDDSVKEYILHSWVLPDLEHSDYAYVMREFYSILNYLLENIWELAKNLEDGIDWLFSDMFDYEKKKKTVEEYTDPNKLVDAVLTRNEIATKARNREKIRLYSEMLRGAVTIQSKKGSLLDEYIEVLAELTPREIEVAAAVYEQQRNKSRHDNENELQWACRMGWPPQCPSVSEEDLPSILLRLQSKGFVREITGSYFDYEGGVFIVTGTFRKLMNYLEAEKNDR